VSRPSLADHELRITILEGEDRLSDKELLTLRVLLRAEAVRLKRRADWAGPRRIWGSLSRGQKWAGWAIALGGLVTVANALAGLARSLEGAGHPIAHP